MAFPSATVSSAVRLPAHHIAPLSSTCRTSSALAGPGRYPRDFRAYHIESFTITRNGTPVSGTDKADVRPGDDLSVTLSSEVVAPTTQVGNILLDVPATIDLSGFIPPFDVEVR